MSAEKKSTSESIRHHAVDVASYPTIEPKKKTGQKPLGLLRRITHSHYVQCCNCRTDDKQNRLGEAELESRLFPSAEGAVRAVRVFEPGRDTQHLVGFTLLDKTVTKF